METKEIDVLVIGGGTAGSNSARAAVAAGAKTVVMVHHKHLTNTCVEEGCMPSKSLLAGAHAGESLAEISETKNAHVARLLTSLTDSFASEGFSVMHGEAQFVDDHTVTVRGEAEVSYVAKSIVIAAGSKPFVPPIPGLEVDHTQIMISDDIVSGSVRLANTPKRVLTIGGGPIGLELSTVFHDLGSDVTVLQRGPALSLFDPEFGVERVRASVDPKNFPIRIDAELKKVEKTDTTLTCTIETAGETTVETFDLVLVATGRAPQTKNLALENTTIALDERNRIVHDDTMQTSVSHIYVAGDVTGHHQILHFAAEMGKVAGHNAAGSEVKEMDYDRHMLAVSFDQYPSAMIGLTETEANKRGLEVVSAVRHFNSIGLGILKRQEYGLWKVVAEKNTGRILGSQILGPDSSGELIQVLVPIIHNRNTAQDVLDMTWYHPTYAEIVKSIAKDLIPKN